MGFTETDGEEYLQSLYDEIGKLRAENVVLDTRLKFVLSALKEIDEHGCGSRGLRGCDTRCKTVAKSAMAACQKWIK